MNPLAAPFVFLAYLYLAVHESACVALGMDPADTPDVFDVMGL